MLLKSLLLWEKSWQPYPRNSSCNLEKNSGLIPKIWRQSSFKWIWDLFDILNLVNWSYFGQKVSVMKTFQKVVGIYVLTRAPHCTSSPPHRATGQGLSVGCTALRGWLELYLLKTKIHGMHHPLILRPELYSARRKIHFWSGSIYLPVPCNSAQCRRATREEGCLIIFFQ